jgi:predicted MPP superfamily phosphohydrolase
MNASLNIIRIQIKSNLIGRGLFFLSMLLLTCLTLNAKQPLKVVQFIYTSDTHLGIKRLIFRGDSNVYSNVVNTAMVEKMNGLSKVKLPEDGGVNAGNLVGGIDYLINTGDIANRSEFGIQSAAISWNQFTSIYLNGITLRNDKNKKTTFLLLPGNHDISNAIGFHRKMEPLTDNTSLVSIYNYMFPQHPKTSATYNYKTDKVHYSKNISGVHFAFINMWPDSSERAWLAKDLKNIDNHTPVILFAHDQPSVESKHFTNPNGSRSINSTDKFENLLVEVLKDGQKITDASQIEQRSFVAFLKLHPNIKAYFNGNENENKMYEYKGPDNDIALKTFQVDSPMKGNVSSKDETKLSFQFVTIDPETKTMTVRECLWNTNPKNPSADVIWGTSSTISLAY